MSCLCKLDCDECPEPWTCKGRPVKAALTGRQESVPFPSALKRKTKIICDGCEDSWMCSGQACEKILAALLKTKTRGTTRERLKTYNAMG